MFTQTGTPYYASPEVWKDKPYDSKSDIWSLGCVLYELLALSPPFTARDMKGLYNKVIKGEFKRIPDMYSEHLSNVVSMCLKVAPSMRPTAEQLLRKKEIVLHLRENNIEESKVSLSTKSLLDTIKMPANFSLIKDRLPNAKYDSDLDTIEDQKTKKYRNFSARGRQSDVNKKLLDKERSLSALKRFQAKPSSSKNLNVSRISRNKLNYLPPKSNRPAYYRKNYDRPGLQLPPIARPAGAPSLSNQYNLRQRSDSRDSSRVLPLSHNYELGTRDGERGYRRRVDIASRQKIQQHLINKAFGLPITPINRI